MKKILYTSVLLILVLSISAQVPQSFKYQSVIRNSLGDVLANQNVGIQLSILEGSDTGTSVYTETWDVTTNQFGLVSLNVGQGVTSDVFATINWVNNSYYLQVAVDVSGGTSYIVMGASQLLSVPYALYSNESNSDKWLNEESTIYYNGGNVGVGTSSPSGKLVIKADPGAAPDSVLFEVKDKDGIPLMRITSEGVKIYVKDGQKGIAGGFAVGRYATAKGGIDTTFLLVTPDSTRVYTSPGTKGIAGGFAVGRYATAKGGAINKYFYTGIDSTRIYLTENPKGIAGGFAVGRYATAKSNSEKYFYTDIDSTRIWTQDSVAGFGVRSIKNNSVSSYMQLTPQNYFIGHNSGKNITRGLYNNFFGYTAGENNTEGFYNTFIGYESGFSNIGIRPWITTLLHGYKNTFVGYQSGKNNIYGDDNTFIGSGAGLNNTDGRLNTFIGTESGHENTLGYFNVFLGTSSGYKNTEGRYNTFIGHNSGHNNINGEDNVFLGLNTGTNILTGQNNVSIGNGSLGSHLYSTNLGEGSNNVYIGKDAAARNDNGNGNIFIGYQAGYNELGSNKLYIENSDSDTPLISGDFSTNKVTINDVLILTPTTEPTNPVEGELFVKASTHHIYCYLNGTWVRLD